MNSCMFCGSFCAESTVVCDSESCLNFDRELTDEFEEERRRQLHDGVIAAISQRCKEGLDGRLTRWAHCLKFLSCVAMGWSYGRRGNGDYHHSVIVAEFNGGTHYCGWSCEVSSVGFGWRRWWYSIDGDGDCTM